MANTIGKKYITDESGEKFYPIGHVGAIYDSDGNTLSSMMDDGWGSKWYTGTAMSGTSTTTNAHSYSACPTVKLSDMYLNTSYGYVYQCTTAGSGSNAKWTYKGSIRGAAGQNGSNANANDRVPYIETKTDTEGEKWKIIYNAILNGDSLYNLIGNTTDNYKFANCIFQNVYTVATQWTDTDGVVHTTCTSGFQMPNCRLEFINCTTYMDSDNIDPWLSGPDVVSSGGMELNFIYSCKSYKIDTCTFILRGTDYTINIVKDGSGIISNSRFEAINYYGDSTTRQQYPRYNIHHYNTDYVSRGVFVGNYVEFGNSMNIQAGVISGNEFNALDREGIADNQIYLECPTCMTGNHFKGYAVELNGRNYKHVIDRNLSDGGLTIATGTTATGSIITNNVTY